MNRFILLLLFSGSLCPDAVSQHIAGKVLDAGSGEPLPGTSLRLPRAGSGTQAGTGGEFMLPAPALPDTLVVFLMGYREKRLPVPPGPAEIQIRLEVDVAALDEVVVSTGYYQVPKERATGSFTHIDNELINRSVSTHILDRLEGVTASLHVDRRHIAGENAPGSRPALRVRGVSTIESDESPLIVVDNFPYEGDLNTINPNDVESITVLKDAAAASIWGARAGNGVIVITTKQGRYNQKAAISFSSSVNIGERPDLHYNQRFLPSGAVMDIEAALFEQGYYAEVPQTAIPAYVELLINRRDGLAGDADFAEQVSLMEEADVRDEALKYLYRPSVNQQYALNVRGGGPAYRYYLSAGYDHSRERVAGNGYSRLNLNLQNTFRPLKDLELTAGVWYTRQQAENNGLTLSDLSVTGFGVSPYIRLAGPGGDALPIVKDYRLPYVEQAAGSGLLDWHYRPLDETRLADNSSNRTEIRLNGGLKYNFLDGFHLNATYQYMQHNRQSRKYFAPGTYYVRNLVNRFTQEDGTRIIPQGGILVNDGLAETVSHSGRVQLNYNRSFHRDHTLAALAGAEIRQQVTQGEPLSRIFDYDAELLTGNTSYDYTQRYPTRPRGTSLLPAPGSGRTHLTDRYLSYFGNAAYTYLGRYTLSGSIRWDGSNIFGVKTNQKGVPLWSLGGSWEVSKENFYGWKPLPYLRLRFTYGSSGNVNKSVSVYPIASYGTDPSTGLPRAALTSAGNPDLRWEQVRMVNLGLDFGGAGGWIRGSLDYYIKHAGDLIGLDYMDPTTGIIDGVFPALENKINYANLKTRGLDLELTTRILQGMVNWETSALFSYVRNKVTHFSTAEVSNIDYYFYASPPPVTGKSRDAVYALPWHGLDPATGLPAITPGGGSNTDYVAYYTGYHPDDLILAGVSVPPFFGSLRNTLSWKGLELSANITWKAGYVFRRSSMLPGGEYYSNYHMDYFRRWQQPGDEMHTDVPAGLPERNSSTGYINSIYAQSETLVTRGDHIRLQDIRLSYSLFKADISQLPLQQVRLYVYARNLGIIWRADNHNLDPDYPAAYYPEPRSIALGIQVDF